MKNEELKSVLLTFSRKNVDVFDILNEISKDGTKKTDYICDAVRYYRHGETNKSSPMMNKDFEENFKELFYKYMDIYNSDHNVSSSIFDTSDLSKSDLEDD